MQLVFLCRWRYREQASFAVRQAVHFKVVAAQIHATRTRRDLTNSACYCSCQKKSIWKD